MEAKNRPDEETLGERPPSHASLGALSSLPEVLLAELCSFLSGRDLARLGGSCSALHESPYSLWPSLNLGLRDGLVLLGDSDEEGGQRRVEALGMLARRAASSSKELRMEEGEVMDAFCSAVRAGGLPLRLLTSLRVSFSSSSMRCDATPASLQPIIGEMLSEGQLPMLHELHLNTFGAESLVSVWGALGEGACPRLERISFSCHTSQQVAELAEALRTRPKSCVELKALCLQLPYQDDGDDVPRACEPLRALISRLSPGSLEKLSVTPLYPGDLQAAVLPLLTSECAVLKALTLSMEYDFPAVGDCLLYALARGAAPSLNSLNVSSFSCSDEAWRALGVRFSRAMMEGASLSGLKELSIGWPEALYHEWAMDLVEALACGAGQQLEMIECNSDADNPAVGLPNSLLQALVVNGACPKLRRLHLTLESEDGEVDEE